MKFQVMSNALFWCPDSYFRAKAGSHIIASVVALKNGFENKLRQCSIPQRQTSHNNSLTQLQK